MKLEDFANGDWKGELIMFILNVFIAGVAAAWVFMSDYYDVFSPAVFFIVFLLLKISDQLTLSGGQHE